MPEGAALPPGIMAAPTVTGQHFAMVMTVNEFLISMGISRIAMTVGPDAHPVPVQMIEWFQTLSISPQAAQNLRDMLSDAVAAYEAQFGKLPQDEKSKIRLAKHSAPDSAS
jgi:hypothetical protein